MRWEAIESGMGGLLETASQIDGLDTRWEHAPEASRYRAQPDGDAVLVSIVSVSPVDLVERVYIDGDDGTLSELMISPRRVIIQARAESRDQPWKAVDIADRIATGLRSGAATELMCAMGLGLVDAGTVRSVPYERRGRMHGAAVLEMTFSGSTVVDATPDGGVMTIGRVEGSLAAKIFGVEEPGFSAPFGDAFSDAFA